MSHPNPTEEYPCDLCEGTGQVEKMTYTNDDSTGHNTIVEGTGTFFPCSQCVGEEDTYKERVENNL